MLEFGVFTFMWSIFRPWDGAWIGWMGWNTPDLAGSVHIYKNGWQTVDGMGSTMAIDVWSAMGHCELARIENPFTLHINIARFIKSNELVLAYNTTSTCLYIIRCFYFGGWDLC